MKPDVKYYDEFPGKEKKLLDEKEKVEKIEKKPKKSVLDFLDF